MKTIEVTPELTKQAEEFLADPSWDTAQDFFALFDRCGDVRWSQDYAEPGYSLEEGQTGVLLFDWNPVPQEIQDLLETRFSLEWSDEWIECACGKCVRTSPDDMSWEPSFWYGEGEITCRECIVESCGEEYLEAVALEQAGNNPEMYPGGSCGICKDIAYAERDNEDFSWESIDPDSQEIHYGSLDALEYLRQDLNLSERDQLIAFRGSYSWRLILVKRHQDETED